MGLTFGGAYLAGGMAQAAVKRADIARLADGTDGSWSDAALLGSAQWDQGALAIAKRHDPYTIAGAAERDRDSALYSERLERFSGAWTQPSAEDAGLKPAIGSNNSSDVAPFRASQLNSLNESRELDCLTTAVYYEARGEGTAGMKAVAQVVLNRARHPGFPKSVCGVIYQGAGAGRGCQFSFACDGSMRRRKDMALWERAQEVAARAMDGEVMETVGASTFFHATRISPNWRGLTRVATVGRHVFYKHAGSRGSARMFVQGPLRGGSEGSSALSAPRLYKVAETAGKPKAQVVMASMAPTSSASYSEPVAVITPTSLDELAPIKAPETIAPVSLDAIVDAAVAS
jgi:spore germination cell wall hydrolase CwlJ-like protein